MYSIINNPYRITGLLAGASAREQNKQISRLKQYIAAQEEPPQNDYSFPILGPLERNSNSLSLALAKLNINQDKLESALFWFYNGNHITDEAAFEYLRDNDPYNAIEIWSKLTATNSISQKNSSAFHNLSTLFLCNCFENNRLNLNVFENGLSLKMSFLESDFVFDLKNSVTDNTHKISKLEIQISFLKTLQFELEKHGGVSIDAFLKILNKYSFEAKTAFFKGFIQKIIDNLEKKIKETASTRKSNVNNAITAGQRLFKESKALLDSIKGIVGAADLKFSSVSDKVAEEVLQCGIDYFIEFVESTIDPGDDALRLCKNARKIAIGPKTINRCEENINNIEEWIEDRPNREKSKLVVNDIEKLKEIIDNLTWEPNTVESAVKLIRIAKPYLNSVKSILGKTDDLYLTVSTRIASEAQGMCVSEVNNLQNKISTSYNQSEKLSYLLSLKAKVETAWSVSNDIGLFDLKSDFRSRYLSNKSALSELRANLNKIGSSSGNSGPSRGGECYIATMVYGSYNHPQVLILRNFRDEVLSKSALGKWFISFYYKKSPKLVILLHNKKVLNFAIRKTLDQIIKIIKK